MRRKKLELKLRRSGKVQTQVTTPDSEGELSPLGETEMRGYLSTYEGG